VGLLIWLGGWFESCDSAIQMAEGLCSLIASSPRKLAYSQLAAITIFIQFPEPDQAEKSADLVPRPVITSLLGQAK